MELSKLRADRLKVPRSLFWPKRRLDELLWELVKIGAST